MTDFKIIMTPQPPTPQRIAAALSLKELAPHKFEDALKNKNFVPFIEGVQRNWRIWLSRMKKAGYAALDSKKFGYARNCPPVLVSSAVDSAAGFNVRLVPCRLPTCPFCHARAVMKIQETLSATLTNLEEGGIEFVSCDVEQTTLVGEKFPVRDGCVQATEAIWSQLGGQACTGSISRRAFWFDIDPTSEPLSYRGRLSFIQVEAENPMLLSSDLPIDCRYNDSYIIKQNVSVTSEKGLIAKKIGKTFAYPSNSLLFPAGTEDGRVSKFALMLNELHKKKRRFYRTSGICRGNTLKALPSRQMTTKSWRQDVDHQLSNICNDLTEIKNILTQRGQS